MKKLFPLIAALGLAFSLGTVHAADKEKTPQQMKMTTCNADAKTKALKGDDRKKFMSECLSAKTEAPAAADGKTAQQTKMTTCNADAKTKALKGDERKKFMSDCLKG
ncbi:psiF repeat-containing protein [Rhodoferax sp. OV413]|uniref:PsiF family protein n=1 Tax=Rhodoferax sp. OV413 TaxID=1855285 RepID=UPI000888F710|nr:PsiF family protein [Rhodoferax sp. OV413]SDO87383.1 psiF repeat-containing protein [Rhodoferax sp. OV413]